MVEVLERHPNGHAKVEKELLEDGYYFLRHYDENDRLWNKSRYNKDDERDGPTELYHKNGMIRSQYSHEANVSEGPYKTYYDNGDPDIECSYKYGKLEGLFIKYQYDYDGDSRAITTVYKNGKVLAKDLKPDELKDLAKLLSAVMDNFEQQKTIER